MCREKKCVSVKARTMKTQVYSYLRFSTPKQAKGDSVRRQTEAAAKWCEENDGELVEDFRDHGVSAYKGKNADKGALGAFLKLAESGRIPSGSVLVVEALDRLTREEIMSAVALFLRIADTGVTIITTIDGQAYNKEILSREPTKIFIPIVSMIRGNEESAYKAKRIRERWADKRANIGEKKLSKNCPRWLKLVGNEFQIIESKAAIVRRIFDLICEGKGLNATARALNDEKVPTFRAKGQWLSSTIISFVDGRTALGELQPHVRKDDKRVPIGAPIEGYYPAIITAATWARAQRVRASHRTNRCIKKAVVPNAFRGLIFSKKGEPLHNQTASRKVAGKMKRYTYLRGYKAASNGDKGVSWHYSEFKKIFIALAKCVRSKPEVVGGESKVESIKLQIEEVRIQEANLATVLANGYIPAIESKLRELGSKRIELEDSVVNIGAQAHGGHVTDFDWKDDEALAENVRATISRIVVDSKARTIEAHLFTGERLRYSEHDDKSKFEVVY